MIHNHGVCFTNAAIVVAIYGQLSSLDAYVGIAARDEGIGWLAVHVSQSLRRRNAGTVAIGDADGMCPNLRLHFFQEEVVGTTTRRRGNHKGYQEGQAVHFIIINYSAIQSHLVK